MPYTDNTFPTDTVGSGDPYQGTGFTNFDRYLQEGNVEWGSKQPSAVHQGQSYDTNPAFDNWMINASGQAGFKPGLESLPSPYAPEIPAGGVSGGASIPQTYTPDPSADYPANNNSAPARESPTSTMNTDPWARVNQMFNRNRG